MGFTTPMKTGLNLTFLAGIKREFSPVLHFPDSYFLSGNDRFRPDYRHLWAEE